MELCMNGGMCVCMFVCMYVGLYGGLNEQRYETMYVRMEVLSLYFWWLLYECMYVINVCTYGGT